MRIALCGEARSGKDTVANLIMKEHHFWLRQAFGDYMKEAYYNKYPERLHLPKDREHMIRFSQPKVNVYPRIWVDKLESMMHFYLDNGLYESVIITDLRQPHEETWCRENGFHIVRVHRSEEERRKAQLERGENPDNKDLPYWVEADFHIYNDGSLEDLQKSCKKLLQVLEITDKIKTDTNEVNKNL